MALDLSALTAYVEENEAELIEKALLGGKTLGMIDVRNGIKSSAQIPVLESTAPFQSAASCGFTTSGATTVTPITLATSPIAVAESICLQDLEAYFTQKYLPGGANVDTASIAQDIINRKVAHIAKQVEQMIWQGKTSYTNSTTLKQINGFLATIDAGSPVTATASTMNATNVLTIFENIYSNVPSAAQWNEEVVAFCGMDVFKLLTQKITSTYSVSSANYLTDGAANKWELTLPGTNMKVTAVPGLNNDNPVDSGALPTLAKQRVVATYKNNLTFGTDLADDSAQMESWYSKDDRVLKFYSRFRAGVAVKFMDHVVEYTNS